jgi:hypothetical protein
VTDAFHESEIRFRSDVTVELVKHSAGDQDVLWAARVSTAGGLINYLMRDRHGSPFEHNSMTFFVSAPIFVFREFHRHRVGWSYNEESGRYRELQPVFYVPGEERKLVQRSVRVRGGFGGAAQGRGGGDARGVRAGVSGVSGDARGGRRPRGRSNGVAGGVVLVDVRDVQCAFSDAFPGLADAS